MSDIQRRIVTATPTIDTNAFAAGDQMGSLMTLKGGMAKGAILDSLVVIDAGKQSKGFTVLLFNASPTILSVDNAALDISDAEMAAECVGSISVATANYVSINGSSVATIRNIGIELAGGNEALYAIMMADEIQTHGASDLTLKFGVRCG